MSFSEFLHVIGRRKLIVLAMLVLIVGAAFAYLEAQTPVYEAESTVALSPGRSDDLVFFAQIDAIIPIYADAATTRETRGLAELRMGNDLGDVSVQTTGGTSIFKIQVRDSDPEAAAGGAQALTEALLERVERGEVGLPALELTQAERPLIPGEPVFPKPELTLAAAVVIGLGAGMGGALLRESLTSKIETADDLTRATGVPCFGEIPREAGVANLSEPAHLTERDDLRIVAEAFRDLRTNLLYAEDYIRSIVVTSPEGSHGKTTVGFGLATIMAQLGADTVLVDGDLRRGRLAEMMKIERSPGLKDCLAGMSPGEALRDSGFDSLAVLTGGELSQDPDELFESEFQRVLRTLESMYDVVIVDATPLVPVNDARIMASFATHTLLVASAEAGIRQQLRVAVERLSLIGVNPTAVVLNKSKAKRAGYYAYLQREDEKPRRWWRLWRRSRKAQQA